MFFLIGRRYPWLSLVVGAVMLAIGVSTGYVGPIVVGCVALVFGGLRCAVAVRRRGVGGLFSGPGGVGGMGGFGGTLR
jgi:hypothetical protein